MAQSYLLPPLGYLNSRLRIVDKSQTQTPLSAVVAGAVGFFYNGPVGALVDVSDDITLETIFDTPTDTNYNDWFNVSRVFLYKANGLNGTVKVSRAVGDGSLNGALAVTDTVVVIEADLVTQRIDNADQALAPTVIFDTAVLDSSTAKLKFFSKYPTNIVYNIAMCKASDFSTANIATGVSFADNFNTVPTGTEVAIAVMSSTGTILEKWVVDLTPGNVDGEGNDNYIENVINLQSQYILCYQNGTATTPLSFESTSLKLGTVVTPLTADYITALSYFEDTASVDINYMIGNDEVIAEQITLCEGRQDCSLRWGAPVSSVKGVSEATAVTNLVTYATTTVNVNTTYASFYGNAALIYDKYGKTQRWITLSGDIVGAQIMNNLQDVPWQAIAGLTRGQLKNIIKLAFNPKANSMRTLQLNKINPVISKVGQGNVIWGFDSYTTVNSKLKNAPTRELIIYVWRSNKPYLEAQIAEILDDITFNLVESKMIQFFEQLQSARGIYDFRVSIDKSAYAIDNNILGVAVAFTPVGYAKEVQFSLVIASTGSNLEELV